MSLKTKKRFFFILLAVSSVLCGYRLYLLIDRRVSHLYDYAIAVTFLLICAMSLYEWLSIRKKLGEFDQNRG